MTTARVLDGLIQGSFNGVATGALTASVGTAAMKSLGYLNNVPFSSIIKPSVLGTGLLGSLVFSYTAFYNMPHTKSTAAEKDKNAGFSTFVLTGCGLLGQALLYMAGNENPPLKQLAFALIIGNAAISYGTAYLSKKVETPVTDEAHSHYRSSLTK